MASLFAKFKQGLQKTATALTRGITSIFTEVKVWDKAAFDSLEKQLIEADLGPVASRKIVEDLRNRYELGELKGSEDIVESAVQSIVGILQQDARTLHFNPDGLTVILFVGVNGSGKTTSIGKLAHLWQKEGKKVVLAACDTFRAAAVEQLTLWADRTGAALVSAKPGADPAAVAFDAVKSALAKNADVLLIDTAGRQQNKKGLMDELAKMRRTIGKLLPDAPHETILTIDASLGTNVISQAKEFSEQIGASALILTKLDGSGKGGAACAVQEQFSLPVLFVGLGEAPDDLQEFSPENYARAIFAGES